MNKTIAILFTAALMAGSCSQGRKQATAMQETPHLEKRGGVTQLMVEGQPWLVLGCELGNSTSSSRNYMAPYWQKLKDAGVNTVLAVVSWEQTEPVEGQFDFTVVDHLLEDARSNDMKLALLWFGSWKNGITSYTPTWVKRDTKRFPLAQTPEGKSLPILTTLGDETCQADAKAFAAMMRHLKEADARQQTVVMIQMENEVGLHGHLLCTGRSSLQRTSAQSPDRLAFSPQGQSATRDTTGMDGRRMQDSRHMGRGVRSYRPGSRNLHGLALRRIHGPHHRGR